MRVRAAALEVFPTTDELMHAAAAHFVRRAAGAIAASGRFAVALSGGSTPLALYRLLATGAHATSVDWNRVHVFWSDERAVSPDDAASNYRMARESLLDHVAVPAANVHRISGEADPEDAAQSYERELRRFFATPEGPPSRAPSHRFDFVLLGMGADGHTASLFPGTAAVREKEKWVVALQVAAASMWRITLTPLVINAAADVTFLVCGREKTRTLQRVIEGRYEPDLLPAQVVAPLEGRLRWLVDASVATNLAGAVKEKP